MARDVDFTKCGSGDIRSPWLPSWRGFLLMSGVHSAACIWLRLRANEQVFLSPASSASRNCFPYLKHKTRNGLPFQIAKACFNGCFFCYLRAWSSFGDAILIRGARKPFSWQSTWPNISLLPWKWPFRPGIFPCNLHTKAPWKRLIP